MFSYLQNCAILDEAVKDECEEFIFRSSCSDVLRNIGSLQGLQVLERHGYLYEHLRYIK